MVRRGHARYVFLSQCICPKSAFRHGYLGRYHEGLLDKDIPQAIIVHNERIKKLIPSDELLIYDVSEGWEPLCKFLGV